MVRWGTHGAGEGASRGVGGAFASLPSSPTVDEGGEATYRVRLTSDPGQPVWVALHWEGDTDLGNPRGCVDDPENTGVTAYITATERDDD